MTEEIQTKKGQKNTIATIAMIFSIVGLILLITIFGAGIGFFLLLIGLILGIIGLFYNPKKKARIAVCIPLIVFIILACVGCYIRSSVKTPAKEFLNRTESKLEDSDNGPFNDPEFESLLESELNSIANDKSKDEWKSLYKTSTGSNSIEKGSYLFFSVLKQAFENALEKYNENALNTGNNNNLLDEDTNDETINLDNESDEETQGDNTENETNNESGQNDIEEILNILE